MDCLDATAKINLVKTPSVRQSACTHENCCKNPTGLDSDSEDAGASAKNTNM